jgi:dUTP pyrophosphatase
MMDLSKLEEIQKQLLRLQNSDGEISEEDYQKEFDEFINTNFGLDFENELNNAYRMKEVKIMKLHPDAVIPKYNYPSDSGFDLHSIEKVVIPALGRAIVRTGLSFQFEEGLEIQMRPKSGLSLLQGITILNTPGTIDQGYSGEVKAIVYNTNQVPFTIMKGMKIAQAVLCPVFNGKFVSLTEVESFEETDRKDNGFGSTGII